MKLLGLLLVQVPGYLINPSGTIDCDCCSQSSGHAHGQLCYIAEFGFGVFCNKATSRISTEESSHQEPCYNNITVQFSLFSYGQSIIVLKSTESQQHLFGLSLQV